jgi:hypothetical protein
MHKSRFRSVLDKVAFVVVIMAAAVASAVLDAAAVLDATPRMTAKAQAPAKPAQDPTATALIQVASRGALAARR